MLDHIGVHLDLDRPSNRQDIHSESAVLHQI